MIFLHLSFNYIIVVFFITIAIIIASYNVPSPGRHNLEILSPWKLYEAVRSLLPPPSEILLIPFRR